MSLVVEDVDGVVDGGGRFDSEVAGEATKTAETAAVAPPATMFAVESLVLLRGELLLQGGGGGGSGDGGQQKQHPGVAVMKSARFRMTNVSSVAGAAVAAGASGAPADVHGAVAAVAAGATNAVRGADAGGATAGATSAAGISNAVRGADAADAADAAGTADANAAGTAAGGQVWHGDDVVAPADGGCGGGDGSNGSDSGAVALEVAGEAKLGEAWDPKPFFLGTSLSQLFPSVAPALSQREAPPAVGGLRDGGVDQEAAQAGVHGDLDDLVVFDGVVIDLKGESTVRGHVSLVGTAGVQVRATYVAAGPAGSSQSLSGCLIP